MNKKIITIFALIGIFLCGAVVGGVVSVRYARITVQKRATEKQINAHQWTRISRRLDLTEEQREKIANLISSFAQKQQATHQALREQTQAATSQLEEDIRSVLTPAQIAEYEKRREREKPRPQRRPLGEAPPAKERS